MIIPALLLVLCVPSRAQTLSFALAAASIEHALPSADELATQMRQGTREERMAAVMRASGMIGGFDSLGQMTVIRALREQAESLSAPGEVRGKAYIVIGEQVSWLRDDQAKREAVGVLLDALEASPGDSREGFRRNAVKGLWAAAGSLPQDEAFENRAANTLIATCESSDSFERTLALYGLDDLLRSRPRVASLNRVGPRLQSSILEPIARDPSSFSNGRRDGDERWAALKVLAAMSWACGDPSLRMRVRTIMSEVAQLDPNPVLRRQADLWARSIRA